LRQQDLGNHRTRAHTVNLQTFILVALQVSIVVTIFGFGLKATKEDLLYVVSRPGRLIRCLLAMFVIMPVLVVALAKEFDFLPAVEIAIVSLALSPVPPLLPKKEGKAAGRASFALSLMVTMALLSVVIVPVGVHLLGLFYGKPFRMGPGAVAKLILTMAMLPLVVGMIVRTLAPVVAEKIASPALLAAEILLPLAGLAIVGASANAILALVGNGTLIAIIVFILAGLMVGHLLGGPDPEDRAVLALSTASRHPGIAMAVAAANYPGNQAIGSAILLYFLVNIVLSIPYVRWQMRRAAAAR